MRPHFPCLSKWLRGLPAVLLCLGVAAHARPLAEQVQDVARQALLAQVAQAGWLAPQLELTQPSSDVRGPTPACPAGWQIEPVDLRQLSRLRLLARCPGATLPPQHFLLRGQLHAEVLVAAVPLTAGQTVTADVLELQWRDIGQLPDALSTPASVVGQSLRTSLRAGQVVQRRQLQSPALVRRGQTVRVVFDREGLRIEASATALEAGAYGDLIKVRNSTSGRVINARVLDDGLVEPSDGE